MLRPSQCLFTLTWVQKWLRLKILLLLFWSMLGAFFCLVHREEKKTPKEPGSLDFRNLMVGFQMWLQYAFQLTQLQPEVPPYCGWTLVLSLCIFNTLIPRELHVHGSFPATALTVCLPLPSLPIPSWEKSHRPAQFTGADWSNLRP